MRIRSALLLCLLMLLFPNKAYANAGLPMIVLTTPAMALALVPVIFLEAYVVHLKLTLSFRRSLKVTGISNVLSTFVGIPLVWLALVVVQMFSGGGSSYGLDTLDDKIYAVTLQAPWLIPYGSDLHWMIPIAIVVLYVPFFFTSWLVEFLVSLKMEKGGGPQQASQDSSYGKHLLVSSASDISDRMVPL